MHVKVQRKKETHLEFMGYGISHSQLTLYSLIRLQVYIGLYTSVTRVCELVWRKEALEGIGKSIFVLLTGKFADGFLSFLGIVENRGRVSNIIK